MQHVKEGNLICVEVNKTYYYFLILSRSAFFGCQWAYSFHLTSDKILDTQKIINQNGNGFLSLIDFIEERRENKIVKLDKNIDITPFFIESKLKARIDTYKGGHQWYIYSWGFSILKKQNRLYPWQKRYPVASGMKCKQAIGLINKKWVISQVVYEEGKGQYPHDDENT